MRDKNQPALSLLLNGFSRKKTIPLRNLHWMTVLHKLHYGPIICHERSLRCREDNHDVVVIIVFLNSDYYFPARVFCLRRFTRDYWFTPDCIRG